MEAVKIDLSKPRYPQDNFVGRLKHFLEVTNPKNLFASDASIRSAQTLVSNYQAGTLTEVVDEEKLWASKVLVDSSVHPDTNEIIFLPFRMASFVPTNLIVTTGLLLPNPTTAGIIFWQWANQSVNVAINWANANKSTPMSVQETSVAYATAVLASVSVALGLTSGVRRLPVSPKVQAILGRCVPFVAVATASSLNVFLMRRKEIIYGIDVTDENGNQLGKSKQAGINAVSQVALSRVLTAFPALLLPPLILSRLEKTHFLRSNPRLNLPINAALVGLSLLTALPCAIATFPQIANLDFDKLEPEFKSELTKEGKVVKTVYFNKGL